MGRLKLEFPGAQFETELTVRISDINYGQHLGNDAVLALAHEVRVQFLAAHGFSEKDAGGVGLIMLDAAVTYRAQAKWGDRLLGQAAIGEAGACDFEMYYRFVRKSDGAEVAVLKTTLAFFDYKRGRVGRMPDVFRQRMLDRAAGRSEAHKRTNLPDRMLRAKRRGGAQTGCHVE